MKATWVVNSWPPYCDHLSAVTIRVNDPLGGLACCLYVVITLSSEFRSLGSRCRQVAVACGNYADSCDDPGPLSLSLSLSISLRTAA